MSDIITLEQYKKDIARKNEEMRGKTPTYDDLLWYYSVASYMLEDQIEDKDLIWQVSNFAKAWSNSLYRYLDDEDEFYRLYNNTLLLEAPHLFDSYMLYLEKDREPHERFYQPKKNQLQRLGIIQSMQDLEDDKLDLLSISMPPGTGKTTLEKFFTSWTIGKHPKDYSLFFSHSGDITRMYYDGVLDITTSDEYKWGVIFPDVKLQSTDAKRECINFDKYKPFANLQCTSVGSKNAGKVRCNRYLYCDDLIGGIEEALNKAQLDKLWRIYSTDARQRKLNDDVKEIHIATRWSVCDVIGRLKVAYDGNKRARFLAVPDIDPDTGESNFDYEYNGMTVDFFNDQALLMDDVSYKCLYKNEPIEREGLLFPEDNVRRYLSLPKEQPDEILAQCDTKGKGTDYMVMPVIYRYGEDYYMVDCVCDNGSDYEYQYESLANMLCHHEVNNCDFERNAGGDRVALEVSKRVDEKGWICNITDTPTETNKEARIFQCSNWIMQHLIFKDKSMYANKDDYGKFMSMLLSYSVVGKNPNDDVPDVLSNLALRIKRREQRHTTVVISSPF